MNIAITGHRPPRLYGYNLNTPEWDLLKERIKKILITNSCTKLIEGAALGTDMIAGLAAIELKESGYCIELEVAIPCQNQDIRWSDKDKEIYQYILSKADKVTLVNDKPYEARYMEERNRYMVDNCDMLIAVYDHVPMGGTFNCIKYATGGDKQIIFIEPNEIRKDVMKILKDKGNENESCN